MERLMGIIKKDVYYALWLVSQLVIIYGVLSTTSYLLLIESLHDNSTCSRRVMTDNLSVYVAHTLIT